MMIKNAKQKLLALATALTLTLTMAGCTAQSTQETESAEPQQTQEVQQTENAAGGTENVEIPDAAEEVAAFDPEYSDRDKSPGASRFPTAAAQSPARAQRSAATS